MAVPAPKTIFTPEEYLRIERDAPYKSEYYAGEMFAMAGGSPRHSLITANAIGTFRALLKGRQCRAYDSNLRVGIPADDLYTYPDVTVFCAPMTFIPGTDDTATNPTVIVEVLSKATEAYDRGKKFEHYRKLESLREYLLVSQDSPVIERFTKEGDDRWVLTTARGIEAVLPVGALGVEIPVAEIFDGVNFEISETVDTAAG